MIYLTATIVLLLIFLVRTALVISGQLFNIASALFRIEQLLGEIKEDQNYG